MGKKAGKRRKSFEVGTRVSGRVTVVERSCLTRAESFRPVRRTMAEDKCEPSRSKNTQVIIDRWYRNFQKKFKGNGLLVGIIVVGFIFTNFYIPLKCSVSRPKEPSKERVESTAPTPSGPTFMLHGDRLDSGYLKHVIAVLERLGFTRVHNSSRFNLLWSHVYPFGDLAPFPKSFLQNLQPYQKVNHFPGSGFFTNKVDLATSDLKYVPKAFHLPSQKNHVLEYSKKNPDRLFVQKSNSHRSIKILPVEKMDLDSTGTFVQEYVQNPFLIDGLKFDIGLYTVLTSVDPLRVYLYNGDVLLRFCAKKYEPFDPEDIDKYVVGDDYIPIWEVPSLKKPYNQRKMSMKETLNIYIRKIGKDPRKIWNQMENSIRNVFLEKEEKIIGITRRYKNTATFFEMVRFDFILDENLNVYLMEINMSPNLSSEHFPPNQLLYENVLFALFSLVGVGKLTHYFVPRSSSEEKMEVGEKSLMVFGDECSESLCENCGGAHCAICYHCLTSRSLTILKRSYLEYINKMDYKRIFPPPMDPSTKLEKANFEEYSPENRFLMLWFLGKCHQDKFWCVAKVLWLVGNFIRTVYSGGVYIFPRDFHK